MRESLRRLAVEDPAEHRGSTRRVRVELMDGDYVTLELDRKAKGDHLLDKICETLEVDERDYFGLLHACRGDARVWVDLDKRLAKTFKNEPWEVRFAVKFYPPEPADMCDEHARYQLALAVRRDLREGRLTCSDVTHALLTSYVLQSELGDRRGERGGEARGAAARLRAAPLAALGAHLEQQADDLYARHQGQSPAEAELRYLEVAKRLPLYGADLHAALDCAGRPLTLAVGGGGIAVYRAGVQMNRFPWAKITKLSYNKRQFSLTLRPTDFDQFLTSLTFGLVSAAASKKLWRAAVEHHMFFRREKPVGVGGWVRRAPTRRTLRQLRGG